MSGTRQLAPRPWLRAAFTFTHGFQPRIAAQVAWWLHVPADAAFTPDVWDQERRRNPGPLRPGYVSRIAVRRELLRGGEMLQVRKLYKPCSRPSSPSARGTAVPTTTSTGSVRGSARAERVCPRSSSKANTATRWPVESSRLRLGQEHEVQRSICDRTPDRLKPGNEIR